MALTATVQDSANSHSAGSAGTSLLGTGSEAATPLSAGAAPALNFPPKTVDTGLLWSGFAAFNVVACAILFQAVFPSESEVGAVADGVRLAVSTILSLLLLPLVVFPMVRTAIRHLDRGLFSIEVVQTFALGLLFGLMVYGLGWHVGTLRTQNIIDLFPVVVFAVLVDQAVRARVERWFRGIVGLDLSATSPVVKVFRAERSKHEPGAGVSEPAAVAATDVKIGDEIALGIDDLILADGVVVQGGGEVHERHLSGFGAAAVKGVGQELYAGSVVRTGSLRYRVTSEVRDSAITDFLERLPLAAPKGASNNDAVPQSDAYTTGLNRTASQQHWVNLVVLFLAGCGLVYWSRHTSLVPNSTGDAEGFRAWTVAVSLLLAASALQPLWLVQKLGVVAIVRAFLSGALVRRAAVWRDIRSCKTVVLDGAPEISPQSMALKEFSLVDRRLDEDSVKALVVLLFGRYGGAEARAVMAGLRPKLKTLSFFKVEDFNRFDRCGMTAVVEGAEITIGGEEILIPRGVQLQATEVYETPVPEGGNSGAVATEFPVYVAIGDEVAARLVFVNAAQGAARQAIDDLHRQGVRTLLMGRAHQADLDRRGRDLSLELGHITGGLAESTYAERMKGLKPVILCGAAGLSPVVRAQATVNVSLFDEMRWNIDESEVVLCGRDMRAVAMLVKLASLVGWAELTSFAVLGLLGLLAFATAGFGVFGPTATIGIGIFSALTAQALLYLVAGRARHGFKDLA